MIDVKITCDKCGANLTWTDNCDDYLIVVESDRIPSRGPTVTLMHVTPQIKRKLHFCGLACMKPYVMEKL